MLNFYQNILRHSRSVKGLSPLMRPSGAFASTIAEVKTVSTPNTLEEDKPTPNSPNAIKGPVKNGHHMIKSVFASLELKDKSSDIETPLTDQKMENATTVDELLSLSAGSGVSRKHALKVVSILSSWISMNKVSLKDFESDHRFLRLCKILTKSGSGQKPNRMLVPSRSDDLSTVLSVTADEEAAKLVSTITLSQMIKVLTTLSLRKRRSTLLLRTLAYNIAGSPEQMNLKECADLFYSIASLNFYDENLFERAANNVMTLLQTTKVPKSSVVGSILVSVGLLKYKNPALLEALSDWILENQSLCRPQDIFSVFMTLGVLNYRPSNADRLFKVLIPQLTQAEAGKPAVWLDIVWSLVLLDQANAEHISSVLTDDFIDSLENRHSLNMSQILKLLNIDGAAHYLLENYQGPKIAHGHQIRNPSLELSKEKAQMVTSLVEALKSLIPESYFRTRINTGLGFYIDAECVLDKTCNPLPLTTSGSEKVR